MAMILCSRNGKIGEIMWAEHPTLRSLMKMTTTMRYRFPPVDAGDTEREVMKKAEQDARDKVSITVTVICCLKLSPQISLEFL